MAQQRGIHAPQGVFEVGHAMPPKKYQDFVESAPHARLAKQHPKHERDAREYVSITPADACTELQRLKRAARAAEARQLRTQLKAINHLNRDNRAARDLQNCFDEHARHPDEARAF